MGGGRVIWLENAPGVIKGAEREKKGERPPLLPSSSSSSFSLFVSSCKRDSCSAFLPVMGLWVV